MARLTMEDKYKIQQGLIEGNTIEDIATKIGRTTTAVNKYKGEFQEVANSFAKLDVNEAVDKAVGAINTKLEKPDRSAELIKELQDKINTLESKNHGVELLDEVVLETIFKLKNNGIKPDDAKAALTKVASKLRDRIDDPARLTALCMQQLSVHNTMITEAVGGREGVAVMTSAASQIIDEQKKHYVQEGHRVSDRQCILNPKTGKVT